jgi:hypothetical protein
LIDAEHYDRVRPVGGPPRAPAVFASTSDDPTDKE